MTIFAEEELRVIDALARRKRPTDQDKETVASLKTKLGAIHSAEIPARFVALTGWSNRPKDYA